MEDSAIMWKQVPQVEVPVVKKVCLTLLNRLKPYWMTALWRQRIFFYIKRAFSKNILWGQQQRPAPCSWHLQSCHKKAPAPSCSPTHSYILLPLRPAASSTHSLQGSLETIHHNRSPVTIGNKMENHFEASQSFKTWCGFFRGIFPSD